MSDKLDELMENEVSVDLEKRKFMSKFGKYAAVSVGMATLMTPTDSAAFDSSCKPRKSRKSCGGDGGKPKWVRHDQRQSSHSGPKNYVRTNYNGNPHSIKRPARP